MRKGERKLLKDSIIQYVKENTAKISLEELDTVLTAEAIAGYFQVKRNTVSYYLNLSLIHIFQKMLDNFDKKYSALAKSYKGKRSMAEIMTIASMIEREASNMSERPMIAGVIENRLAAKMRLQIDPTVLYTTTNGLYNAKKVYYKDLKVKTVYNTYVMKGLPAGPVSYTHLDVYKRQGKLKTSNI